MSMMLNNTLVESLIRNYAESNMLATVRIVRPSKPVVQVDDGIIVNPGPVRLIYEGKGRLYTVSGPQPNFTTDEDQVFSTSYISVPLKDSKGLTVESQLNDLIEVLKHSDPLVVNRVFRVLDVDAGGQWPAVRRHMVSSAQRYAGWTWITEPEAGP